MNRRRFFTFLPGALAAAVAPSLLPVAQAGMEPARTSRATYFNSAADARAFVNAGGARRIQAETDLYFKRCYGSKTVVHSPVAIRVNKNRAHPVLGRYTHYVEVKSEALVAIAVWRAA